MRQGFNVTQYEAACRKRTRVSSLIIFILIPATIATGCIFLDNERYMVVSLALLVYTMVPFFMVFEKRKPKAREIVLIAMMAAITVCAQLFFHMVLPLQIGTALIIISGIALGPEAGFLIGATARFICNFYMGQGPWTPWQMFCWGMIGFVAGLLENRGFFRRDRNRTYFTGSFWTKLCPNGTNRGDLLYFARGITNHASLRLCLYGMATGFAYGWVMNLFFLTYVDPLTWKTALAAYVSSFFFDFCHGLCTFLVLWAVGEPWIAKLNRIKVKFGLIAEEKNYKMPPSQHTAPQAEG